MEDQASQLHVEVKKFKPQTIDISKEDAIIFLKEKADRIDLVCALHGQQRFLSSAMMFLSGVLR